MAITKLSNSGIATGGVLKYDSMLAGNTAFSPGSYESIATVTVGAGGSSSVVFSSIPSTYTHLQLRCIARSSRSANDGYGVISYNSDTGTNYSYHSLFGQGSAVGADGAATVNYQSLTYFPAALRAASIFGFAVFDILDYANTNKYKTLKVFSGYDTNGAGNLAFQSGNWRNTNAITNITITEYNGNNFVQYSSFALYGIKET
jgi:hypothetical protein